MTKQKSQHVDAATAVGKRLREARERAGLSQSGLAGSACSPAYISRIEVGARVPSLQLLRQLGKRLGVSADYLATGLVAGDVAESARLDAEVALRLDDLKTARRLYEAALAGDSEGLTRSGGAGGPRSDRPSRGTAPRRDRTAGTGSGGRLARPRRAPGDRREPCSRLWHRRRAQPGDRAARTVRRAI